MALYRERGFWWPAFGVFFPPLIAAVIWAGIARATWHDPSEPGADSARDRMRLTQLVVAALCIAPSAEALIARGELGLPYGSIEQVLVGLAFVVLGNKST